MKGENSDNGTESGHNFSKQDNLVQEFRLENSQLRGRAVRLGDALDQILAAHDDPKPVAHLVAEVMTLTALLSSMLQYNGIFTLQIAGDGPVNMLVADITSGGQLRGCASFDEARLEQARAQLAALKTPEGSQNHLAQYLGKGRMAFTVDQDNGGDRQQGIVEIKGASLTDCVQHYFTRSENIMTGIKMAAGLRNGVWRAGGIMLQRLVGSKESASVSQDNTHEDEWRRAMILLDTCTENELLDPDLHQNDLLLRFFHEEGVRVFEPLHIRTDCRCDREKVKKVLAMMPQDDLDYMEKDGKITMRCEFCSRDYVFSSDSLKKSRQNA